MEGSSSLKSAERTPFERIAMRRPAPLNDEANRDRETNVLRAARRWRSEWRKERYDRLRP